MVLLSTSYCIKTVPIDRKVRGRIDYHSTDISAIIQLCLWHRALVQEEFFRHHMVHIGLKPCFYGSTCNRDYHTAKRIATRASCPQIDMEFFKTSAYAS